MAPILDLPPPTETTHFLESIRYPDFGRQPALSEVTGIARRSPATLPVLIRPLNTIVPCLAQLGILDHTTCKHSGRKVTERSSVELLVWHTRCSTQIVPNNPTLTSLIAGIDSLYRTNPFAPPSLSGNEQRASLPALTPRAS